MSKKHPRNWFYMYVSNRHVFRNLNPTAVEKGLIATLDYFATGEIPEIIDPIQQIVFNILKEAADESLNDYAMAVENGKLGPAAKAAKAAERENNPP